MKVDNNITHRIPREALERFVNSKHSVRTDIDGNKDNTVIRYSNSLSPKTRKLLRGLMRFCWIVNKTPSELIDLCYKKISEDIETKEDTSRIEKFLDDFETYILGEYDNPTKEFAKILPKNTTILIAKMVKGFFKANKIPLSKQTLKKLMKMPTKRKRTYVPTKKDIRKFVSYARPRDKLLIQFMTNIPLRREEIIEGLTWKKLGDLTKPYPMIIYRDFELKGHGKGKFEGCLFLGIVSESLRKKLIELKEHDRKRFTKTKRKFERKGYRFEGEFSEDTKVFLSSEVTINEEEKTVTIEPLGYKAIGNMIFSIQKMSKIPLSVHRLRDYFQDMLNAHATEDSNSVYGNALLGHKISGTRRIYSHPERQYEKVLAVFKKIEPYVDLDYDESKASIMLKERAKELQKEGKSIEEIIDIILKEKTQLLLSQLKGVTKEMSIEVQKAEEEYKRRTEE